MSQRIKALEERAGTVLVRRGQPCSATDAGARLCRHAETLALLEQQLHQELPGLPDDEPGARPVLRLAVNADSLALHCTPALNLFPKRLDRVALGPGNADFHVVPDRTRPMDYDVHSLTEVLGYGTGVNSEWRFLPFYQAFHTEPRSHDAYYAVQRVPRIMSQTHGRDGTRTSYLGTEVYLSIVDANGRFRR